MVIPKSVRDRLGLGAGAEVEITERDGWVEIAPVPTPMTLVGDKPVAQTPREMPALTIDLVRQTLERVRH